MNKFVDSLPDTLRLLAGERTEEYELERLVGYTKFLTWLIAPNDERLINLAGKIAVARAMRDTMRGNNPLVPEGSEEEYLRRVSQIHFSPQAISYCLLTTRDTPDPRLTYVILRHDAEFSARILRFLVQLDQEQGLIDGPPSVNRAMRFVGDKGYDYFPDGTSHQKIKEEWSKTAASAPFLTADYLEENFITYIPPTNRAFFTAYLTMFGEDASFRRFLGASRYLQERAIALLHPSSREKIKFVEFPVSVEPVPVPFEPFDERQRKLITEYRVHPELEPKRTKRAKS